MTTQATVTKKNVKRNMSQKPKKTTAQSVDERLHLITTKLHQVVEGVNQALNQFNSELDSVKNVVNALIELAGKDTVKAKLTQLTDIEKEKKADTLEQGIKEALERGEIESVSGPIEVETQLLCLKQKSNNGQLRIPSRVFVDFGGLTAPLQELFRGKMAGDVIDYPAVHNDGIEGDTVEVASIYQVKAPAPVETDSDVK